MRAAAPNAAISTPANGMMSHAPAIAKPAAMTADNAASEPKTKASKRKSSELAWRLKYVNPAPSCSRIDSKMGSLLTGASHSFQTRGL